MILLIGAELAKTSIQKILSPEPITTGMVSILILAASILVKFWDGRPSTAMWDG